MTFGKCFYLLLAVIACTIVATPLTAQDYAVRPVPAAFAADADTTFLVDLSSPKSSADFAAGVASIVTSSGTFLPEGGYRGVLGFSMPGNFPAGSYTLEALVRVPSSAATLDLPLAGWSANGYTASFTLSRAVGVHSILNSTGFSSRPQAGGNGITVQASAPDKWVYAAFGIDFAGKKHRVIAREVSGEILNKSMGFCGTEYLEINGSTTFSEADRTAKWAEVAGKFSGALPASFSFGHTSVELRALRISNRYRREVLEYVPDFPEAGDWVWTPRTISSSRTQSATVTRTVGYPGYQNYRTVTAEEEYIALNPQTEPISVTTGALPVGVYSAYLYGYVNAPSIERVWRPTPMRFSALQNGGSIADGLLLVKQSLKPKLLQAFHAQVAAPGAVTLSFHLPERAAEEVFLTRIVLKDQLAGLPAEAMKTEQRIFENGPSTRLTALTEARKARDAKIWAALPPLNLHLQVHDQYAPFRTPPAGVTLPGWTITSFIGQPYYYWYRYVFEPFDFTNTTTGEAFTAARVRAHEPFPGALPDDGTGIFFDRNAYPALTTHLYNDLRAYWLGHRYLSFLGAVADDTRTSAGLKLAKNYFSGGDPELGHDAAVALIRWAYDWPGLERFSHELRLSTMTPDLEYNSDWTESPGKMYGSGWSADTVAWLFDAYDQIFPYIENNQVLADSVHRFIPSINTPKDVIAFLDQRLVWKSVADMRRGYISGDIEDRAGELLGPKLATAPLFDLTKQASTIYPLSGTYQEMYGTALSRSGCYYIGSFLVYGLGSACGTLHKASMQKAARESGAVLTMDLSDTERYRKVRGAGDFLVDMWVSGGFPFMVGDASGGPHTSVLALDRLKAVPQSTALRDAFELYQDPRHAWLLKNVLGDARPEVAAAAQGVQNPIVHNVSRVVADYGAVLELEPQETDLLKKTAATLRLGVGRGHSHHDYLDLNLYAMGLPVAVDLACRNEGSFWSRPHAGWAFLHNHAIAHATEDPNGAGAQTGEPWLRTFAPPLLRASYTDQTAKVRLDRDLLMMEVGDTGQHYAVDVQKIAGDLYHTWSFHGIESDTLEINVPMSDQVVRWTDRTLENTQKTGVSGDVLQAVWTGTRAGKQVSYTFSGGGTFQTLPMEQTVLGTKYDASKPPLRMRATLLGRAGDTVLQGNPYSSTYAYSFPFLWVQKQGESVSLYPALYEWYRGDTPTISAAELINREPLSLKVTTSSGQVDTYQSSADSFTAISRDSGGVRWAKLSGVPAADFGELKVVNAKSTYTASITDIDYRSRTLRTSAPLPSNPHAVVGNSGRRAYLNLRGTGSEFTWDDDLLIHEGAVTDLKITASDSLTLTTNQTLLFSGWGNRKAEAFTVTNEEGSWQFRGGKVIKRPNGAELTRQAFTDANGDGFINAKTYEIGPGDSIELTGDIEIRRTPEGYDAFSNVDALIELNGKQYVLVPSTAVQKLAQGAPPAPTNLRIAP